MQEDFKITASTLSSKEALFRAENEAKKMIDSKEGRDIIELLAEAREQIKKEE